MAHHKLDCVQVYEPIDYLHLLGEDPILPQGGGAKLYVASGDSSQGVLLLLRPALLSLQSRLCLGQERCNTHKVAGCVLKA